MIVPPHALLFEHYDNGYTNILTRTDKDRFTIIASTEAKEPNGGLRECGLVYYNQNARPSYLYDNHLEIMDSMRARSNGDDPLTDHMFSEETELFTKRCTEYVMILQIMDS